MNRLLLPAAACGCLLLPACSLLLAACCCCCWLLLLLWCCCRAAAIKQPPKQETAAAAAAAAETPWPWRTNGAAAVPTKTRPCYGWGNTMALKDEWSTAAAAAPTKTLPSRTGNTMALKDERSPKYACPGAGTSLLKSPTKSLLAAAAADAADPSKRRLPARKPHATEGRRNVPSEISDKKLAIRFSRLAAGSLLAAALLPLRLLLRLLVSAAAYWCCCLLLPAAACCLLLPAAPCCCAHKDTARPDGETPWPWRTNRVQNMCFPGPERPFWNLVEKACYTFLDAGYWELLLLLTLQKGGFRQGNPMLLKGDSDCCCCCAHKDTALPDGETPWPWRTNRVQNMRVPGPERPFWNLLQKACYTFLEAGYWLAASCCTAAVALTAASAYVCCCLLMPAAACCCLLLPAAACCLLLPAAPCCCLLLVLLLVAAAAVVLLLCCCNQTASKARNSYCCCCAHKDTALPDGETPWPWRTNGVQNRRVPGPERPFWNLLQKACYTFLEAGCWLAASCCTAAVALTAASACVCCCVLMPAAACCCLLPAACCCLLLPAAPCCCLLLVLLLCCCNQTASKARNSYCCCCCCCAHKDTALPDGETPWPWRTNRVQNRRFPGPERPFWNLLEKACYTFLDAGYWELLLLLVHLTLQKGGFRQGNPMLLKGDSDCCCCCCAHKDTALPDGETPWPWRTNRVQNMRVPGPERPFWNLLQKACYTFLEAGCWLAASCCTAAVALTAASACVCCCLLMPAAACCCLRLPAACCCLLLPAAAPTKTRPARTGKHHGLEGRTESKICVSRGLNVPSEIS